MSDKKNDTESKYIYDRARKRLKTKGEHRKEKGVKRKADQNLYLKERSEKIEKAGSPDMDLGCWFFLILPFIGTILALVLLIGFLMQG